MIVANDPEQLMVRMDNLADPTRLRLLRLLERHDLRRERRHVDDRAPAPLRLVAVEHLQELLLRHRPSPSGGPGSRSAASSS